MDSLVGNRNRDEENLAYDFKNIDSLSCIFQAALKKPGIIPIPDILYITYFPLPAPLKMFILSSVHVFMMIRFFWVFYHTLCWAMPGPFQSRSTRASVWGNILEVLHHWYPFVHFLCSLFLGLLFVYQTSRFLLWLFFYILFFKKSLWFLKICLLGNEANLSLLIFPFNL